MNIPMNDVAQVPPNSVRTAARRFAVNLILFKIVVPIAFTGWSALQGARVSPEIGGRRRMKVS
jgi:hypothetical protein